MYKEIVDILPKVGEVPKYKLEEFPDYILNEFANAIKEKYDNVLEPVILSNYVKDIDDSHSYLTLYLKVPKLKGYNVRLLEIHYLSDKLEPYPIQLKSDQLNCKIECDNDKLLWEALKGCAARDELKRLINNIFNTIKSHEKFTD